MHTKSAVGLIVLVIGCLGASAGWAQTDHVMVSPADLKWGDVPSLPAGAKIAVIEGPLTDPVPITFRLKFPADYRIPAHSHPGIEHVTVISGTLNLGTGDKLDQVKTTPLAAGSVAIMPPKTNHFGWTKDETIVQVQGMGPWGVTSVQSQRRATQEMNTICHVRMPVDPATAGTLCSMLTRADPNEEP